MVRTIFIAVSCFALIACVDKKSEDKYKDNVFPQTGFNRDTQNLLTVVSVTPSEGAQAKEDLMGQWITNCDATQKITSLDIGATKLERKIQSYKDADCLETDGETISSQYEYAVIEKTLTNEGSYATTLSLLETIEGVDTLFWLDYIVDSSGLYIAHYDESSIGLTVHYDTQYIRQTEPTEKPFWLELDAEQIEQAQNNVIGSWRNQCIDGQINTIHLSENSLTSQIQKYTDNSCLGEIVEDKITDIFQYEYLGKSLTTDNDYSFTLLLIQQDFKIGTLDYKIKDNQFHFGSFDGKWVSFDDSGAYDLLELDLSLTLQQKNLCGLITPYNHYEVVAYSTDNQFVSRHQPNEQGQVQALFTQSHINLKIIQDGGDDPEDKKDLIVTVLNKLPLGELGTLTIESKDQQGCQCQSATVSVQPGYVNQNLPHTGTSSYSGGVTRIEETQICQLQQDREALLVVDHLDNQSGNLYYQTIENPSQSINDGEIHINITQTGQVGRAITVDASPSASHSIEYVTDQTYNYYVRDKSDSTLNILDHPRVEPIELHAYMQTTPANQILTQYWGVHLPIDEFTTSLSYQQPEFSSPLLLPLLDNLSLEYDFSADQFRVISGFTYFFYGDGSRDQWRYILPNSSDQEFNFSLPAEYTRDDTEAFSKFSYLQLNEIQSLNSLDTLYQTSWLKVLLPHLAQTLVRPPAAYSYVSVDGW